jgi:hypothetical protein
MDPTKTGFASSEFWGMVATLATSVLTLFVVLGLYKPHDQQATSEAVTNAILAFGAVAAQVGAYWRYAHSRTEVKKAAIAAGAFGPAGWGRRDERRPLVVVPPDSGRGR